MQLRIIKGLFHKELDEIYGKEEVDSFFYLLIGHYLGLERFVLALNRDLVVSKEMEQPLFEALAQLRLHRPIQYIIGKAHFMDLDFSVDERVLIPRPETEELVRWVIEEFRDGVSEPSILDVGTGSGCIAISLAKNLSRAKVFGLDISEKALEVARQNSVFHQADIEFLKADILNLQSLDTRFDVIVSNPPYVREQEKRHMQKNVLEHEPGLALFVSDDNPLMYYGAIVRFARKNLNNNGTLYLEINQYLGKETEALLTYHNFSEIELRKDMFGNERMLKAILS